MDQLRILRKDIDLIDKNILDALAKRGKIVEKICEYKKEHKLPIVDLHRFQKLLAKLVTSAKKKGLSKEYIKELRTIIHRYSIKQQGQSRFSNNKN